MYSLALSDSFEYLCYECTAISNIFTLIVQGLTSVVRIWRLYRRLILTTKVDHCTVRVKSLLQIGNEM